MKKTLVALAALAATGAFAQSSLTFYGTLDLGLYTQNKGLNSDPNAASSILDLPASGSARLARVSGMASSNTTPSKWGIKGVEDMDGGNKTFFQLESMLNVNYGTNPNGRLNDSLAGTSGGAAGAFSNGEGSIQGQMFDREATLGMSGSWGTLKGGRQVTVMADTMGAYDPMKVGYAVSPLGFNGGYSGAGFTAESRWDNSLKYMYTTGASTVALGYKTAGTTNGLAEGAGFAAAYEYAPANWGVKVAYEKNNDAVLGGNGVCTANGGGSAAATCTTFPSLALTMADTHAFTLVGKYLTGAWTFKGGAEQITTANPANATYDTTANFPQFGGIPVSSIGTAGFNTPRVQNMYFVGTNYQATDRIELMGAVYRLNTSAYGSAAGVALGTSTASYYSVEGTYSLSKRTRVYVTGATSKQTGPVWNGAPSVGTVPNITTLTTGVVHSF